MFSSTQPHGLGDLPAHFSPHAAKSLRGSATFFTLRVDTPCMHVSKIAQTSVLSPG